MTDYYYYYYDYYCYYTTTNLESDHCGARSPVTIENDIQRDKAPQRSLMSGFSSTQQR